MLCENRTDPTVIQWPRGPKKVCTVTGSSTTNTPKSSYVVATANAQRLCGLFGAYSLFAHISRSPTSSHSDLFNMYMQCLSDNPVFGFIQSRTRISSASREPKHLTSFSLACFTLVKASAEGDARTEKGETDRLGEKRDEWDCVEIATAKSQSFNSSGPYLGSERLRAQPVSPRKFPPIIQASRKTITSLN